MLSYPAGKRPMSTADRTEAHTSTNHRPGSSHKIKPEQLSALKQRVRERNQNKQNNPMFRSDNILSMRMGMHTPHPPGQDYKHRSQPASRLSMDEFEMGDLLGRGAQAKVRLAVHKLTRSIYSIKTIPREKVEKNLQSFIRSMKIQMCLNHPNIAKVYGIIVESKDVHVVMQYCIDGDLSMNLRQLRESKSLKSILLHIAQGLEYIHLQRIHHRDIKLENILLNCGVPKITDFELSVYTRLDFFPRKTMCGSPAYFCPEMIEKQRYNKKADIWCLGIVFYELLCGYFPFEVSQYFDVKNIADWKIRQFPESLPKSGVELITRMLCKESENRISIEQILGHEFFYAEAKQSRALKK